jgi:hypothetical protein
MVFRYGGLHGAWKEVAKVHGRFCKKITGLPNCAVNGFVEIKLGRDSRHSKCLRQILKYWYHVMCLETEEPIKQCYKWQKCNIRVKSWAMEVNEEQYNIRWRK